MPKNPALLAQKLEGIFIVKIRFYGMEEFCLVGGLVYILLQSVRLFICLVADSYLAKYRSVHLHFRQYPCILNILY